MTTSELTSAAIAALIRQAILDGEFVPNQRLVEADLCELYSASRANVRGALVDLANEGLVERLQNRGARVRAVSLAEAIEISEVRMVLEGLCAYKAAERVTPEEEAELHEIGKAMKDAVASGDLLTYSTSNKLLHARVGEISRQTTANQIIQRVRAQIVRHQYRLAMHPGRPAVSLPEHLEIIEAICAHDPDAAEAAVRRHMRSVIETLQSTARRVEGDGA
ncbi:DNA-binding GntR family transcriptional regulator [Homoserinimonas aerilata]|uniref:DNA-binding GntR family transcriptional regulator n=1 Tax=Homoserinimonas aerilata TaxID=1162970 RepID=A0A542YAB1_9MICO|nr:GntR family transcriptional regulator [Homoserinimonas aerilata]TQL45039.1 DNA-binding GntR family transcriptional regulator [Homoserinimonas aerilata]